MCETLLYSNSSDTAIIESQLFRCISDECNVQKIKVEVIAKLVYDNDEGVYVYILSNIRITSLCAHTRWLKMSFTFNLADDSRG